MTSLDFHRYFQSTDSTCGPTVIRMLLDFYHIEVTEDQIVKGTNAQESLEENGTRVDQLSRAVEALAPGYTLWYKEDASIRDLDLLLHEYKVPVAVNWQGLFWGNLLEEARLSSYLYHGHYSIVTGLDREHEAITIADPFYEFKSGDRRFPIDWFKSRWWDISDTTGSEIKEDISYYTSRLIFVIVPKHENFPGALGLQKVHSDYFQNKIEAARKSLAIHPPFEPGRVKRVLLELLSSFNRKVLALLR